MASSAETALLTGPARLSREWIVERLAAIRPDGDWVRGDQPDPSQPKDRTMIPAAVLVPVVNREYGLTVLLTQRTPHLHDHAGQVSFPGGRVDPGDASREATALREAAEEIGLPPEKVEVLGRLVEYHTVTGFSVTPVVGFIEPPVPRKLDDFEVAEVFEVPLHFLLDPANHQRHTGVFGGRQRSYYAIPYQGYYIWGATAGMLMNLYRALRG